ncbi:MAG: alpha/beta fold hydrolase, partial [Qipengyuania vulgaris]
QNRVLAALLDHWGLRRPFVVAHDFGGATALRSHLLDGCDYEAMEITSRYVALHKIGIATAKSRTFCALHNRPRRDAFSAG